ncbi:hypothetical protein Tco_0480096, partial [Tanacetum coccineum]
IFAETSTSRYKVTSSNKASSSHSSSALHAKQQSQLFSTPCYQQH